MKALTILVTITVFISINTIFVSSWDKDLFFLDIFRCSTLYSLFPFFPEWCDSCHMAAKRSSSFWSTWFSFLYVLVVHMYNYHQSRNFNFFLSRLSSWILEVFFCVRLNTSIVGLYIVLSFHRLPNLILR